MDLGATVGLTHRISGAHQQDGDLSYPRTMADAFLQMIGTMAFAEGGNKEELRLV
jgi:hypothetical protein